MICIAVISKPRCCAPSRVASPCSDLVVGAALARRLDQLGTDLDMGVAAGLVEVVVLHEHRRRQHDVGPARCFGHELFVHADEQVVARRSRGGRGCCRGRRSADSGSGSAAHAPAARRPVPSDPRSARCRSCSCRVRGWRDRAHPGLRSASCRCGTCRGSTTTRRRLRAARRR